MNDIATKKNRKALHEGMAWIPGGEFLMGSDAHYPEEAPAHRVSVNGFWIEPYAVTNADYQRFVEETGYVTLAERHANPADYPGAKPEMLAPGVCHVPESCGTRGPCQLFQLVGIRARRRLAPSAGARQLARGPVEPSRRARRVRGRRKLTRTGPARNLPTEAEWEYAARGGLDGAEFAWGSEFTPDGRHMANTWQGEFPWQNLLDDGHEWTAPVGSYPPNGYGLYDVAGNVWEWTTDWYQDHGKIRHACCTLDNPRGGDPDQSHDPRLPNVRIPRRVMKGGSYLCAPNYCRRYRPAARMPQPVDTSTCHLGFRCIVRATDRRSTP